MSIADGAFPLQALATTTGTRCAANLRHRRRPGPARPGIGGFLVRAPFLVTTVEPGDTLLAAGLAAGLPMPYSCTVGNCGECLVRLRSAVVLDLDDG
ncbi:2Fe-2S iron-sulfur cluster-binding protein [Amycolatopsis sp. NPDC054798]